jgi:hypothetical protein
MENARRRGRLWDLAAWLYLLGTGVAALFSVGWSGMPIENGERDTSTAGLLVLLGMVALLTACAMARAFWRGDTMLAQALLAVSLVSLVIWALIVSTL